MGTRDERLIDLIRRVKTAARRSDGADDLSCQTERVIVVVRRADERSTDG